MGKRKKGKGRKRRPAMTKRDPKQRADTADADETEGVDDEAATSSDSDSDSDSDAESDADSDSDSDSDSGADSGADSDSDSDAPEFLDPVEDSGVPLGLPGGASWALPLLRFQRRWVWLETRMMFASLLGLTLVLCFWIGLRGMKEPLEAQVPAGTVFRALVGAAVLGAAAWHGSKGRIDELKRRIATVVAVLVGLALASTWRGVGITYFEQMLDWLQEGSSITLFGGLKGISTRLTMLVALMGASLAASTGTHINIDVVVRLIPRSARKPVAILTALATAAVCLAASYGFLDHIAITAYRAPNDAPMSEKVSIVAEEVGEQFFVWRQQTGLDLGAIPHVLAGNEWNSDDRMSGKEWNAFLENSGFVERYGAEKVELIKAPQSDLDMPRQPFVIIPDGESRGIMVHFMDLLWPVGFFMLFLKFLLQAVLIGAGQVRVAVEGEESANHEADVEAAKEAI